MHNTTLTIAAHPAHHCLTTETIGLNHHRKRDIFVPKIRAHLRRISSFGASLIGKDKAVFRSADMCANNASGIVSVVEAMRHPLFKRGAIFNEG